jgi:hypothetical protein
MYGADTLAPYLAETKAEREKLKSGKAMDEAQGLGALLAAAKMIGAPNLYKGAEGAIEAFAGEVNRVKKDNKEAERLLRSSEIQLATAAQARKEGTIDVDYVPPSGKNKKPLTDEGDYVPYEEVKD